VTNLFNKEKNKDMKVHEFKIPNSLCELINSGVWPDETSLSGSFYQQEFKVPIIKKEALKHFPDFDKYCNTIVLYKPPFRTIADNVQQGNDYWIKGLSNVGQIDYKKAVMIADFGFGSDSVIILYYENTEEPSIMYLKYYLEDSSVHHAWVKTHNSFDEFAKDIGLI
jgi:hypothetical protein